MHVCIVAFSTLLQAILLDNILEYIIVNTLKALSQKLYWLKHFCIFGHSVFLTFDYENNNEMNTWHMFYFYLLRNRINGPKHMKLLSYLRMLPNIFS